MISKAISFWIWLSWRGTSCAPCWGKRFSEAGAPKCKLLKAMTRQRRLKSAKNQAHPTKVPRARKRSWSCKLENTCSLLPLLYSVFWDKFFLAGKASERVGSGSKDHQEQITCWIAKVNSISFLWWGLSPSPRFLPSRPSWRGVHSWLRGHIWPVLIRAFVASQANHNTLQEMNMED